MSIFQFDTRLLMDPMYKRSHKVFPRHFPRSLCCQRYRSFFCWLSQCSGVWQSYVELSATLQFKVCIMTCMEIWLSFQISRGKMSVCRVFGGLLSRIQFDWPESMCRPMCNACHPKILHCTTAWKSTSGTDLRRFLVEAEQTDKISNVSRDKKRFTMHHSLWLLPSSLLPALRGDPTTGSFTLKQRDAFPFGSAPWTESPPAQVLPWGREELCLRLSVAVQIILSEPGGWLAVVRSLKLLFGA